MPRKKKQKLTPNGEPPADGPPAPKPRLTKESKEFKEPNPWAGIPDTGKYKYWPSENQNDVRNQGEEGDWSTEDESEDENAKLLTKKLDKKIAQTYEALVKKDPSIYNKEVAFFESESESSDGEEGKEDKADKKRNRDEKTKAKKSSSASDSSSSSSASSEPVAGANYKEVVPMRLKDYARQRLLAKQENGDDAGESESEEEEADRAHRLQDNQHLSTLLYDEEQETLRKGILNALNDQGSTSASEDSGMMLKKDKKRKGDSSDSSSINEGDNGFFDDGLLRKKKHEPKEDHVKIPEDNELSMDDSLEENMHTYLEKETEEEKERFLREFVLNNGWIDKENKASIIPESYKLEHMIDAEEEFLEDVDRFEYANNFRYEDPEGAQLVSHARQIEGSMRRKDDRRKRERESKKERKRLEQTHQEEKVKRQKNIKKKEILERIKKLGIDLDEDFDPNRWDELLANKFKSSDGDGDGDDEQDDKQGKTDTRDQESKVRDEVEKLMEEYFDLEYEDDINDGVTRFKYKAVDQEDFGLTGEQILEMDDEELNKIAPLKYLSTYRGAESLPKSLRLAGRNKSKALYIQRKAKEELRKEAKTKHRKSKHDDTAEDGHFDEKSKRSAADGDEAEEKKKKSKKKSKKDNGEDKDEDKDKGKTTSSHSKDPSAEEKQVETAKKSSKHGKPKTKSVVESLSDSRKAAYGL